LGAATIPTVGDAIEALGGLCDDLSETLKQIADLSAELSSRDHIRVDNIQEVRLRVFFKGFLDLNNSSV
jgi:nuclear pore complex protein Nup205